METKVDLSIIILNFNTSSLLADCLNSIAVTEKNGIALETIVVDNASTDNSVQVIKDNFPWVKLVASKKNLGFAAGNNLALKKAKGEFFLFLNSDTLLPKKIFPEIINYISQHPKVGALTVKLVLRNGQMDSDCHRGFPTPLASLTYFLGLESIWPKSRIFGRYHQFYKPLEEVHEIESACGAFFLVREKVLREVGGWDEQYFFYGEDIDFAYRIRRVGWEIIFYPSIEVIHYKGASSGLREETADITKADKITRLKAARASIEAMKIFYNKFYRHKYPWFVTTFVIWGIQIKGFLRFLVNRFKS